MPIRLSHIWNVVTPFRSRVSGIKVSCIQKSYSIWINQSRCLTIVRILAPKELTHHPLRRAVCSIRIGMVLTTVDSCFIPHPILEQSFPQSPQYTERHQPVTTIFRILEIGFLRNINIRIGSTIYLSLKFISELVLLFTCH